MTQLEAVVEQGGPFLEVYVLDFVDGMIHAFSVTDDSAARNASGVWSMVVVPSPLA